MSRPRTPRTVEISVTVSKEAADHLIVLASSDAVQVAGVGRDALLSAVVEHLIHSAADGVRRPGSWERGWLTQAFGRFGAAELGKGGGL